MVSTMPWRCMTRCFHAEDFQPKSKCWDCVFYCTAVKIYFSSCVGRLEFASVYYHRSRRRCCEGHWATGSSFSDSATGCISLSAFKWMEKKMNLLVNVLLDFINILYNHANKSVYFIVNFVAVANFSINHVGIGIINFIFFLNSGYMVYSLYGSMWAVQIWSGKKYNNINMYLLSVILSSRFSTAHITCFVDIVQH